VTRTGENLPAVSRAAYEGIVAAIALVSLVGIGLSLSIPLLSLEMEASTPPSQALPPSSWFRLFRRWRRASALAG
jgi:hypothetical protein